MSLPFSVCLFVMFALAAIGAPIAFSMIVAAIVYLLMVGQDLGLAGEQMMQGLYDSFVLLAIPLFIAAANIMNAGTISDRLLKFCVALVGHFRGGLGLVNIVANMILAGMSGSAVADAAGLGRIVIGMMTKEGRYTPGYAAAITAAAATIGPIIPPSIPMVLYALTSNASIGYLFLGGILPGVLMGFCLMVMNNRISTKRGFAVTPRTAASELPRLTREALPALLMPVILLYGIYGGIATPTEGAAIAATYALLLAAFFYRALTWRNLYGVLAESARASASVGLIVCGALVFNYVVVSENIPNQVAALLAGFQMSPMELMLGINILLLILGCFLDSTTIILVIVPLFLPACRQLGIDLVYFGVVVVVNTMIGFITPPYGFLFFVINAITGISLREQIAEIWPFVLVLVIALALMIFFPGIVLLVPRMFGYLG
jgi:TRAP-type transport system large permease protein